MLRRIKSAVFRNIRGNTHKKFNILSIHDEEARKKSIEVIKRDKLIAVDNRGVIALWMDGADAEAVAEVVRVKGEQRERRPLAATFPTEMLVDFIDPTKIPESLHHIFLKADELAARTASLCFIRVPITEAAAHALPSSMVSYTEEGYPVIQNWDPRGHDSVNALVEAMHAAGIQYPAVTSMNKSGEPEIVDEKHGIHFAIEHNIPLFLTDPDYNKTIRGSYTIFNVDRKGIQLVRDGNIPAHLFACLFEAPVDNSAYRKSKYPQSEFPSHIASLPPHVARVAIISHVSGKDQKSSPDQL